MAAIQMRIYTNFGSCLVMYHERGSDFSFLQKPERICEFVFVIVHVIL